MEYGSIKRLNRSLSCPERLSEISLTKYLEFPYSDPRTKHHLSDSRVYSSATVLSVSIAWRSRLVLIGVPSLNMVLLYCFDDRENVIGRCQNDIGTMGYGKSVAWLDEKGGKSVILANSYSYLSLQWISSSVDVYDIESDGLSDDSEPNLISPNSD